jgi:hypothetical protein
MPPRWLGVFRAGLTLNRAAAPLPRSLLGQHLKYAKVHSSSVIVRMYCWSFCLKCYNTKGHQAIKQQSPTACTACEGTQHAPLAANRWVSSCTVDIALSSTFTNEALLLLPCWMPGSQARACNIHGVRSTADVIVRTVSLMMHLTTPLCRHIGASSCLWCTLVPWPGAPDTIHQPRVVTTSVNIADIGYVHTKAMHRCVQQCAECMPTCQEASTDFRSLQEPCSRNVHSKTEQQQQEGAGNDEGKRPAVGTESE